MYREELYVRVRWPFRSAERWYRECAKATGVESSASSSRSSSSESLDEDTRFTAAQTLGTVVGKRFGGDRTVADALAWLDRAED